MPLPIDTEILVIGAGPAGSAAACAAAQSGLEVWLVDRAKFPRDKVCGDALIPDALRALDRLSLGGPVRKQAAVHRALRMYAPNGDWCSLEAEFACLARESFDDIVRQAAAEAGAQFLPRCKVRHPVWRDGVVTGAVFENLDSCEEWQINARLTLLATGASGEALEQFGVCQRRQPSAIAARVYLQAEPGWSSGIDYLCISYDKSICPGYGWIFPASDGVFNVGVGCFTDAAGRRGRGGGRQPETNLRQLLEKFLERFPLARELAEHSRTLGALKGAPLRTAMRGAQLGLPGLLVLGEAAGLTYSFSGEGIGKALESGIMAAEVAVETANGLNAIAATRTYQSRITNTFRRRFAAYESAQRWLSYPWVADFFTWRGRTSRYVKRELEGFLQETNDPRALFSVAGLLRSLVKS